MRLRLAPPAVTNHHHERRCSRTTNDAPRSASTVVAGTPAAAVAHVRALAAEELPWVPSPEAASAPSG
jgi:hypothetical protein